MERTSLPGKRTKEGQMMWKGSLKGDQLEGTATWVKPGKPIVEHWFKGQMKK